MASTLVVRQLPPTRDLLWRAVGVCERLASVGMLAALAPVVAGCASVMALVSRRTPLIAHRRVGWRGQALWMLKLRTMWNHDTGDARCGWGWIEYIEDEAGPEDKRADDPRVTNRFARFCRRHSIDEIPQLWHVLRGDMSLVGPRPMTAGEIRRYYERDAEEILQVRPGIAGLWQVSGRNLLTYSERRELDLRFVRHRTLGMYFRILTRTIPEVWRGAGSW